jgi:putative DNA primase/helicase
VTGENDALDRIEPPAFSEGRLAVDFVAEHGQAIRYVPELGKWFHWDEKRWSDDKMRRVESRVRDFCFSLSAACNSPPLAKKLASAAMVSAVLKLVQQDEKVKASIDQWDADPWLLNTPDGVVDLRTGRLGDHDPRFYCTKMTEVAPCGSCPLWLEFLKRVVNDEEQRHYLQRVFGYALTGLTTEHALFFLYGTGANGKSVTLTTVAGILADYARTAPMETFTASNGERHPTDIAGLLGARLVVANETEEGKQWAESKIKSLTGGDRVSARFMRQDFFDFTPQFKLFVAGNHKPGLRTVDEAMKRRIQLVPFTMTIPKGERDRNLSEKLKSEWPGILKWMIEGCREWQRLGGLRQPQAFIEATEEYLNAEDDIASWLEERCEQDPDCMTSSSTLYASWEEWSRRTGRRGGAGSQKAFSQKLADRGFEKKRNKDGQHFTGIQVLPIGAEAAGLALQGLQERQRGDTAQKV